MEEKYIVTHIYMYIYIHKITDPWNLLPNIIDFKILAIFKERTDIYGRSSVIPAGDFSTPQEAHQGLPTQRQEEALFVDLCRRNYFVFLAAASSWLWEARPGGTQPLDGLDQMHYMCCFQAPSPSLAPTTCIIQPRSPPDGALGIS